MLTIARQQFSPFALLRLPLSTRAAWLVDKVFGLRPRVREPVMAARNSFAAAAAAAADHEPLFDCMPLLCPSQSRSSLCDLGEELCM